VRDVNKVDAKRERLLVKIAKWSSYAMNIKDPDVRDYCIRRFHKYRAEMTALREAKTGK
jgi:hypothetical protein